MLIAHIAILYCDEKCENHEIAICSALLNRGIEFIQSLLTNNVRSEFTAILVFYYNTSK